MAGIGVWDVTKRGVMMEDVMKKLVKKVLAYTGRSWENFKSRGHVLDGRYFVEEKKDNFDPRDTVKFKWSGKKVV